VIFDLFNELQIPATIDLVDVCLPTPLHADHVIRALNGGKHVLCELPLATDMTHAQQVVDAEAASHRQVFVDMAGRFDPATETLATAIATGKHAVHGRRPGADACSPRRSPAEAEDGRTVARVSRSLAVSPGRCP
jgi:predicted dehydrogenase